MSDKNPHAQALGSLGGLAGKGQAKARDPVKMRAAALKRWKIAKASPINGNAAKTSIPK